MRYKVDEEIFDSIDDVLDYCIDDDYHRDDDIEEYINSEYGDIQIGRDTYYAYDIVRIMGDLDPFIDDYCENENERDWSDAEYELDHSQPGDYVYCQGHSILVLDDEPGDYDGDETICNNLEDLRTKLNEIKSQKEEEKRNEAEIEDKMLQIIGG